MSYIQNQIRRCILGLNKIIPRCGKKFWCKVIIIAFSLLAISGLFFFLRIERIRGDILGTLSSVDKLTHGPIVGNVTSSSATVFIRTSKRASVRINYGTDPGLLSADQLANMTPLQKTTLYNDFTSQFSLTNLAPQTKYYLNVLIDGVDQMSRPFPSFTTFPPEGTSSDIRIVHLTDFCCIRDRRDIPATNTFLNAGNEAPNLIVIGGDFDHRGPVGESKEDAIKVKREMFKDLYTPVENTKDFIFDILHKYPVAHMWDDHDYAGNNSNKTYQYKAESLKVFKEYFPSYPLSRYGVWQKLRLGKAEIFLLDARSQRDPGARADRKEVSLLDGNTLGPAGQYAWLTQGLLKSNSQWKIIFSPVVFNPTTSKLDAWAGYINERTKLVEFIKGNNIRNVIFVSGDSHGGGIDDGTNSTFPEMLVPQANLPSGTDMSCFTAKEIGIWSEGVYGTDTQNACQGYGVIDILSNPDRVVLTVKDNNGQSRLTYTVSSSD